VSAGGYGEEDEQREREVEAPMQLVNYTNFFSLENGFLTGKSMINA
jgi:hypothetical protein